jgi:hypothetical protein
MSQLELPGKKERDVFEHSKQEKVDVEISYALEFLTSLDHHVVHTAGGFDLDVRSSTVL